ncbi:MAG: hypothetical protein PHE67_05080 [Campylobacterales bacterium]|nr:hypothetical protein [Campylobacterales bacterium]
MELRKTYPIDVTMSDGSVKTLKMNAFLSKNEQKIMDEASQDYQNFEKELAETTQKLSELDKKINQAKGKTLDKLLGERSELINFDIERGQELLELLAKKRFEISILPSENKDEICKELDGSGLFTDFMQRLQLEIGEAERKKLEGFANLQGK